MIERDMEGIKFVRVDAGIAPALKDSEENKDFSALTNLFMEASKNPSIRIRVEHLKSTKTPALITVSEESRRLEEMMQMYSADAPLSMVSRDEVLIINGSSPLIARLETLLTTDKERAFRIASYIYKLTVLSQRHLSAEEMQTFLDDGFAILEQL